MIKFFQLFCMFRIFHNSTLRGEQIKQQPCRFVFRIKGYGVYKVHRGGWSAIGFSKCKLLLSFSSNMLSNMGGSKRNKTPFPLLLGETDANTPSQGRIALLKPLHRLKAEESQEREGLSLLLLEGGKVQRGFEVCSKDEELSTRGRKGAGLCLGSG